MTLVICFNNVSVESVERNKLNPASFVLVFFFFLNMLELYAPVQNLAKV